MSPEDARVFEAEKKDGVYDEPSVIRMVDARHEFIKDQMFGTCELCEFVCDDTDTYFVFEDSEGTHEVATFFWDWGDKFSISIENIPRFSKWFNDLEYTHTETDEAEHGTLYTHYWLQELAHAYNSEIYPEHYE